MIHLPPCGLDQQWPENEKEAKHPSRDQELYQGWVKADITKGKVTGVTYLTISLPHIENFIVQTAPYDKRYISSVSLV